MTAPGLRPLVLDVKARLAEGRSRIAARHASGSPGIQVCRAITELYDSLVLEIYHAALDDLGESGANGLDQVCTVVAHGGTGRQDLAPYSDVDLMLLHAPGQEKRVGRLAERMLRDIFDVGLQLGQSVRTTAQACQAACGDATICTSLIESRRLAGSIELFDGFRRKFKSAVVRRSGPLLKLIEEARGDERNQYGETVYLLEPNVKRSPGGLRDIQFVRWVGFLRYGTAEPDVLRLQGQLNREDHAALQQAWEFLLHLRNEMHFHAGKSSDVLDKSEQLRIAKSFGFEGRDGQLPVEQFMQRYFRLTSRVNNAASRFHSAARRTPLWTKVVAPLVSHRFEHDFRVGPGQIGVSARALPKLQADLAEILRLCTLSGLYDKPIDRESAAAIHAAGQTLSDEVPPAAAKQFLALLDVPTRLGDSLRLLHEAAVLEKLIPAFSHARCLLQFNEYHKYTVDEHTLRAVEHAVALLHESGVPSEAYRGMKRKWLLHLALLLHDLGKGYAEDHSDVGLRIAGELIPRLRLDEADGETLKFLVHKHLVMSHLAFRRDTSDEQLIVQFAVQVGSPEALQMLYVLTCCDTAAVGPGTLNAWKVEVLSDLYRRTRDRLTSDDPESGPRTALAARREEVSRVLRASDDDGWFQRHVDVLPRGYLFGNSPQRIADDLRKLRRLEKRQALAEARYSPESDTTEYWIGTYEDIAPGVFHRLTGALSAQGLQILSAEINTLDDGLIIDRFWVQDPTNRGEPLESRREQVCRALAKSLDPQNTERPAFRKLWGAGGRRRGEALPTMPTRVQTDNSTSQRHTVIDIFAADRRGLLYTITRTLFEMELSVSVAKIGTYLDQVVDVFYVTDRKGKKIEATAKLNEIKTRLLVEIEAFERQETDV